MFKVLIVDLCHFFMITFNRYSWTFENNVHSLFNGCKVLYISTSYIQLIDCIFQLLYVLAYFFPVGYAVSGRYLEDSDYNSNFIK